MAMDILSLLFGAGRAPGGLVAPPRPTQAAYAYDPRVDPAIFPPQAMQPGSAVGGFDSASAFAPQSVGGGPDNVSAPLVMKGDMGGLMDVASPEPIGRSPNLASMSPASASGSGSILDMLGFNGSSAVNGENDLPVKFGTGTMPPSLPPVSGFSVPDSFGKLPSPAGTVPVSAPLPPVSGLGIERQTPRGDLSRPLIPSQPGLSRNPFDVQRGTLPAATEPAPVGDMVPPPQAAQSGQSVSSPTPEANGLLNKLFGANPQSEMYDRVVDMLTGWGMGAGGSWRDSLAMGSKNVAAGRLTRKQEADLAKSTNKTAEWARSRGVDEATIGMFLENKDAKGLISFVQSAGQRDAIEINGQLVDKVTGEVLGDYRSKDADAGYRIMSVEEKTAAGLPADGNFQVSPKGQITSIGGGGVTIKNDLGGGSDKQIFDALNESAAAARSAVTGLTSLSEAKNALDGGMITGVGADQRLQLQKLGAFLGVSDPAVIENTETFRSAIAPQVAAMMKATVGSTQISNADREFAQQAAGGSINLDERSIRRLVDIMERTSRVILDTHNQKLDAVYPAGGGFERERALFGVRTPEVALPPAKKQETQNAPTEPPTEVGADLWEYLTPEERALWQ